MEIHLLLKYFIFHLHKLQLELPPHFEQKVVHTYISSLSIQCVTSRLEFKLYEYMICMPLQTV